MNEAILLGIVAAVSGLLGAAVPAYLKIAGDRHAKAQEVHTGTVKEYSDLLERLEKAYDIRGTENATLRERCEVLVAKLSLCYQNFSRAEERIAALEDMLAARDIPFRKWTPRDTLTGDSAPNLPVQP